MNDIKTDMFPDVLRAKAKLKQEKEKKNSHRESIYNSAVIHEGSIEESFMPGKDTTRKE